ncbi:MAG: UDP-N-acetylmuramoyl-tripeptide--D-alanyl-D-alanine ligase [Clostridia bacterium]|nr:UDP-N-acetylmuramoyl-tripeptide--D-alanyl-D-alanine ligase [Clostridia bacterium]
MDDLVCRIVAAIVCACFYFAGTIKLVGAMQQSGYRGGKFLRWFYHKRNKFASRLLFLSVLSLVATAMFTLVFSFLGEMGAIAVSAAPYLFFCLLFYYSDRKYALKVDAVQSGRWKRLCVGYLFVTAIVTFVVITACSTLSFALQTAPTWAKSMRYLPVCFMPILLPFALCAANAVLSLFENARNRRFVKRAGQVLDESNAVRVGIVGSYGKTSVKNILKTILSEKYEVVASPASYNTPMGVAKTVTAAEFASAQVFLCEMGARKQGDIRELCDLVKPQYIAFTGVCAQHMQTFKTEETLLLTKCEALSSSAGVIVCGGELKEKLASVQDRFTDEELKKCVFAGGATKVEMQAEQTKFTLTICGEEAVIETSLLGDSAVENIALAVRLAEAMGLSKEEILRGVKKLSPCEHRLQLLKSGGVNILDDAYNCNERGAKIAIEALKRFAGRKVVVTPGIVETGVLHEQINGELGKLLADPALDRVILVGETQVGVVKTAFLDAGGDKEKLSIVSTLSGAQELLKDYLLDGDTVLFMNDLPDIV